ncbi:MAG: hypothetical protein AAGF67_01525 [Verrucomicrobiota bacterium]
MKAALVFGILFAGFLFSTSAAEIEVTDMKGRSMTVEVMSYTESSGNVRIKRNDGQFFNVKLDIFDAASQEKIVANAPKAKAELLIRVSVGKRRKQQGTSSYMKDQTISASFTVENDSRDVDFPKGEATLFLIGRQTRRYSEDSADYGKVLSKQKFPVEVKAGEETELEALPIVTSYDSDRDSTNIGGFEYYGYLLVLKDEDGEVHTVETSIGNLKKDVEENPSMGMKLAEIAEGSLVEKNLKER